ncbi:conserved hypothetical protein [Staphylococcus capitis C87]|nr:conserved hypothetical protein [Staphylococcus capitis C87]
MDLELYLLVQSQQAKLALITTFHNRVTRNIFSIEAMNLNGSWLFYIDKKLYTYKELSQ